MKILFFTVIALLLTIGFQELIVNAPVPLTFGKVK